MRPPHDLHGPLGHCTTSNRVVPSSVDVVALGGYIPPFMSRGQPVYQSYNYGCVSPHSQGIPNYNIPMHPFMGHAGGGYYPTGQGHGLYYNQP